MALKWNNCEGATDGTTITTGNSDDNSAGDALAVSTGGTRIYTNAWAHGGSLSWSLSATSGNTSLVGFTQTAAAGMSTRFYFRVGALPSATCAISQMRDSADAARGALQLRSDGKIEVVSHGGGVVFTTTGAVSVDTTYRIEWRQSKGTGTGKVGFAIFAGDSTSPIESFSSAAMSTGTNDFVAWRLGKITGIASTFTILIDDVAMEDQGDTLLGPLVGLSDLNYTLIRKAEIDCTGSVGTLTCTQTAGTSVGAITGPTSSKFTFTVPSHDDVLAFEVTADGDGDAMTDIFYIYPEDLSGELICQGGDPTNLANWQ